MPRGKKDIEPVAIHGVANRGIHDVGFGTGYLSGNEYRALHAIKDGYAILSQTYTSTPNAYAVYAWEKRPIDFATSAVDKDWTDLLPVGNGFYSLDKFGRLTFYDSDKNKVAENIPVHDDFCNVEIDWNSFAMQEKTFRVVATRLESNAAGEIETVSEQVYCTYRFTKYNSYVLEDVELFNHKPITVHHTVYTPDGKQRSGLTENNGITLPAKGAKFAEEAQDLPGLGGGVRDDVYRSKVMDVDFLAVDGYYIKKDDALEPLQFTPLFYQFKKGAYLYGVRGGKLYLKTGDIVTLIGDGLKNFRLKELKKLSKARK